MITAIDTAQISVPLEVIAFAEKNGVLEYLRPVVEHAIATFPDQTVTVKLIADPEIENESRIVINVDVQGWSVEDRMARRQLFYDSLESECPSNKYVGNFVLSMM